MSKAKYIIPCLLIFEGVSSYLFNGSITKTIVIDGNYNIFYSLIFIMLGVMMIVGDYVLEKTKNKKKVPEKKRTGTFF